MRKKLNIGIVGAGQIVWDVHLPLLACFDNVKIKYIADIRDVKEIAKSYKAVAIKVDDDPSILHDCDIALLATPVGGAGTLYTRVRKKRNSYLLGETICSKS